jgi:hypothetical protein
MSSLPRYVMPDASVPNYDAIFGELCDKSCYINSSYYYIRKQDKELQLCRIIYGNGKIFFHEIVDHQKHGISDDDIEIAICLDPGRLITPDHYVISPHIETKLRTLYDT